MTSCLICGKPCPSGKVTCSDECHEKLIQELEGKFGVYKKVEDSVTGKMYRVPTRDIIEKGLRYGDLKNYPITARSRVRRRRTYVAQEKVL